MIKVEEIADDSIEAPIKARLKAFLHTIPTNEEGIKENYLYLACFAAFPVILSSDIFYKIWANFDKFHPSEKKRPEIWSVSQIIHSPIICEIGYDLYEMNPAIRIQLLNYIKVKLGENVIIHLANFMQQYLKNFSNRIPSNVLREAHKDSFEVYLNPEVIGKKLADLMANYKDNGIDIDNVLSNIPKKIAKTEEINQSKVGVIASLAKGLQAYKKGDRNKSDEIQEILKKIIAKNDNSNGYNIQIPEEIIEKLRIKAPKPPRERKVYALIVGINNYVINPLGCCFNDAINMRNYLMATESNPIIITLTDKQATKRSIINVFRETFRKAVKGDSILFYFAGNGTTQFEEYTTESAPTKFTGVKEDAIVCFDYDLNNAEAGLLSKDEIKELLGKYTQSSVHKTLIFDCSFISDSQRRASQRTKYDNCIERVIVGKFPFVDRNQTLFDENSYSSDLREIKNLVKLYASVCNESAIEVGKNGVFTQKLLEYLEETNGEISYHDLHGRVRQELKVKYDQRPDIIYSSEELEYATFLNRPRQGTVAEVSFNGENHEWCLNLGSIHGVRTGHKVKVLDKKNKATYEISIKQVFSRVCYLTVPDTIPLNLNEFYQAKLEGLELRKLKIHVLNYNGYIETVQALLDSLLEQKDDHFILENDEDEANYTLHIRDEKVYITYPHEIYRPLIESFELFNPQTIKNTTNALRSISKWHYIKNIQGDKNSDEKPFEIEIAYANEEKLPIVNNETIFHYTQTNGQWGGKIKIKLKNRTNKAYFIKVCYLTIDFSISTELLKVSNSYLEPHAETYIDYEGDENIPFYLDKLIREYNWDFYKENLKIILTEESIDLSALDAESLPKQFYSGDILRGTSEIAYEEKEINLINFITQDINLKFINPEHNQINQSVLHQMLNFDKTVDFALGLYYGIVKDKLLRPSYILKPEIKLSNDFSSSNANASSNFMDNLEELSIDFSYKKDYSNVYDIVTIGDAWFNYPLELWDLSDVLSLTYKTYHIDIAKTFLGGQLVSEIRHKLDIMPTSKVKILSMGFYDYFLIYPVNNNADWENMRQLLLQGLTQLNTLATPIIIHGYDYFIPDERNKGWIRILLIERKIKNDPFEECKRMVDSLNELIANEVKVFSNLHYLDLRGTLTKDDWYDELHPNDDGFRKLSEKFKGKISEILYPTSETPPQNTQKTILWVDDHPTRNNDIAEVLKNQGILITNCFDTKSAIELLEKNKYDLIISDMGRGEEHEAGLELLKLVTNKEIITPVVIYTTKNMVKKYGKQALSLGALAIKTGKWREMSDYFLEVLRVPKKYA